MIEKRSQLLDLLLNSPAQKVVAAPNSDPGVADNLSFPFLAIVGQPEMKLALLLALVNNHVGGVLLLGPRGTAKTTAVRSLTDILPQARRSLCPNGCTEELLDKEGMDGICKSCQQKVGYGQPLTATMAVRMVELPLNARLEDVVGGINERIALEQQRIRLERGILSLADGNLLYIDEVNLLPDAITDAILDAAAQGQYTVRRGPLKLTYRAQFTLIGSMNPEEGRLRPQILDRFGLRVVVKGLPSPALRYQAYEQAVWYRRDPAGMIATYLDQTITLAQEIEQARQRLPAVTISLAARELGLELIQRAAIDSNRAEITLFEAARAHAAADERDIVSPEDIKAVALLSLRLRRSPALEQFLQTQEAEDQQLSRFIGNE